jgi:hypothetical protein
LRRGAGALEIVATETVPLASRELAADRSRAMTVQLALG